MDTDGPLYREAREALIAQLDLVEDRVDALATELAKLETAATVPDEAERDAVKVLLDRLAAQEDALHAPLRDSTKLRAAALDDVTALTEAIAEARVVARPLFDAAPAVERLQATARATTAALKPARKALVGIVLAYRLKRRLHGLRVGRAVDFKAEYATWLPTAEERAEALTTFASWNHYFTEAVFDVPAEKVWRKSGSDGWRLASCLIPVLVALLAGGALALVGLAAWDADTNLDDSGDLVIAYGLALAGVLAHLVVENVKQSQSDGPGISAVGEWVDWVHLRWASLSWSVAPVLVVTLGLLLSGTEVKGDDLFLFFFAGYSADSIAGTFLTRFGTAATSGVAKATAKAGG